MASQGVQMAVWMTFIGWFMVVVACALPMWRVSAQVAWRGLWLSCAVPSSGQTQCKAYDSSLPLPQDLKAARGLMVMSIVMGIWGVVLSVIGGKCTHCIKDGRTKSRACVLGGVVFILSGLLCLAPVSWCAGAAAAAADFYSPTAAEAPRSELGVALYIGWAAAALLLTGGGLLCWNCPAKRGAGGSATSTPLKSISPSAEEA